MKILSLDMEYNQPSQTIIQVGYVIGDLETGEILERVCREVKVDEIVSDYIVNLTGITQDQIEAGSSLEDIYKEMKALHTKHGCFRNALTWGGGDSDDLRHALGLDDERYLFGRRWIDAKTVYVSRCFAKGLKHQSGLAKSMLKLGLRFEGRKHNALDDAENTFRIYRKLLEDFNNEDK